MVLGPPDGPVSDLPWSTEMSRFYDARGNVYALVGPDRAGIGSDPAAAAATRASWVAAAIDAFCQAPFSRGPDPDLEPGWSDGLLVGPFGKASPFDLLIVAVLHRSAAPTYWSLLAFGVTRCGRTPAVRARAYDLARWRRWPPRSLAAYLSASAARHQ